MTIDIIIGQGVQRYTTFVFVLMPKSAPVWIQTSKSPQASMVEAAHHR
jgi:hypothetical protein